MPTILLRGTCSEGADCEGHMELPRDGLKPAQLRKSAASMLGR